MKKILFVAFVALMAVSMSSCKENLSLTGTKWTGSGVKTMTIDGDTATVFFNLTFNFNEETSGTIDVDYTVQEGDNSQSGRVSGHYDYTFNGYLGALQGALVDIDGDSMPIQTMMVYDVDTRGLTITLDDVEIMLLR